MASRVWLLLLVLAGVAGCDTSYPFREPCEMSSDDCCPKGSHEVSDYVTPTVIICIADIDAGADACDDAGTNAH